MTIFDGHNDLSLRTALSSLQTQKDRRCLLRSSITGIRWSRAPYKRHRQESPPYEQCSTPQLWPWGERLQHEKQNNLFRNLKFHDWLVTADQQTKLTLSSDDRFPFVSFVSFVSFVWWSAVTNQSWNFKLRNKLVCFSCYKRHRKERSLWDWWWWRLEWNRVSLHWIYVGIPVLWDSIKQFF